MSAAHCSALKLCSVVVAWAPRKGWNANANTNESRRRRRFGVELSCRIVVGSLEFSCCCCCALPLSVQVESAITLRCCWLPTFSLFSYCCCNCGYCVCGCLLFLFNADLSCCGCLLFLFDDLQSSLRRWLSPIAVLAVVVISLSLQVQVDRSLTLCCGCYGCALFCHRSLSAR